MTIACAMPCTLGSATLLLHCTIFLQLMRIISHAFILAVERKNNSKLISLFYCMYICIQYI